MLFIRKRRRNYGQSVRMKILHLSDTHGLHRRIKDMPEADVIVHSGDISNNGTEEEVLDFLNWFIDLPYSEEIRNRPEEIRNRPAFRSEPTRISLLIYFSTNAEGVKISICDRSAFL